MCGRYASFLPPDLMARLFGTTNPLPNVPPTWNMAPSMDAPVVRRHPDTGERHMDLLRWGFVPSFTKDLKQARRPINARSETVAQSAMFRRALAERRCIVPASVFYEWQTVPAGKQPYAIARVDDDPSEAARDRLNPIDQLGLAIRLTEIDGQIVPPCGRMAMRLDIAKGCLAVDLGLASPQ